MGAVAGEAGVATGAEDFLAEEARGAGGDDAGEIAAGDAGEGGAVHEALDVFDVAGVDGGGFDLDQDFVFPGGGVGTCSSLRSLGGRICG